MTTVGQTAASTLTYAANQHASSATITDANGAIRDIDFVTAQGGQIMRRTEKNRVGGAVLSDDYSFYFNGNKVGEIGATGIPACIAPSASSAWSTELSERIATGRAAVSPRASSDSPIRRVASSASA